MAEHTKQEIIDHLQASYDKAVADSVGYRQLQREQPLRSVMYSRKADAADVTAAALEAVLTFAKEETTEVKRPGRPKKVEDKTDG